MLKNDLTGMIFGKLKVICFDHFDKKGNAYYKCLCECGKEHIARGNHLKNNQTKSCGCLLFENNCNTKTTWFSKKLYKSYTDMVQRCLNSNNTHFKDYGGRGIKICDEWLNDSQNFNDWAVENGFSEGLTIDRKDTNGNYCPENCRWVDMKIQNRNKRNNNFITFNNETKCLAEWLEVLDIPETSFRRWFKKLNNYGDAFIKCQKIRRKNLLKFL